MSGLQTVARLLRRKIKVEAPAWAPDKQRFFKLFVSPSVPRWEYMPRGPYTLVRWETSNPDVVYGCEHHEDLEACCASFVRLHLPRSGEFCAIIDADHQWVLGWRQSQFASDWIGCEAAFGVLSRHYNQVDVAYWEANARGAVLKDTADRAI